MTTGEGTSSGSSRAESAVRVLDTSDAEPGSGFPRFKAFVEGLGLGARVRPMPGAPAAGHRLYRVRALSGGGTFLAASAVEDLSATHWPRNVQAGAQLRFVVSGEGVRHVPARGPAFSPAAGQLVVLDGSAERVVEVRRRTWRVGLQVPAFALRCTAAEVEQLLAGEVRWQDWHASFLTGFCRGLLSLDPGSPAIPSGTLAGLVAGAAEFIVRSTFDDDRETSASALRRARARDYIARRLHDPRLAPPDVAADQGITLRQLARCFAEEWTTVSAEIKRIRLEHARHFLLAHAGEGRIPLADVARRHGFSSLSHFSRSFAEAYGVPPSRLLEP